MRSLPTFQIRFIRETFIVVTELINDRFRYWRQSFSGGEKIPIFRGQVSRSAACLKQMALEMLGEAMSTSTYGQHLMKAAVSEQHKPKGQ